MVGLREVLGWKMPCKSGSRISPLAIYLVYMFCGVAWGGVEGVEGGVWEGIDRGRR